MHIPSRDSRTGLPSMRTGAVASVLFLGATAAFAPAALAHAGGPAHDGFAAGLSHPFTGLDHVLAIGAVGLWAAQRGGRAARVLPFVFLLAMALGAVLGTIGLALPGIETGIAISCLVLGACVAAEVRVGTAAATGLVAAFAVLHGHAHGTELPAGASVVGYGTGFLAATASLLALGGALGSLAKRVGAPLALRTAGLAVVIGGLVAVSRILA